MVVQRALQWLKRNNKYYRNINIDISVLSQLPDDGDLTDKCGVGIEDTAEKQEEEELPSEDTDPTDVATFIPVVARKMTEKETIRKSVHHRQPTEDQIVPWPENGSVPIDEFKTEGYISCAFPTLFPTGEADYLAPRLQSVTVGMYFKHLMMYGEGRFAKHPRFRYFALNTEMRWRALQTGRVYINQHPDFVILSLDGSRQVDNDQEEGTAVVTLASQLDHYRSRPTTPHMEGLTLLEFVQRYRMPKSVGLNPVSRKKEVVVIVIPFCSPDPQGPKYERYCRQKLMLHQPFWHLDELL